MGKIIYDTSVWIDFLNGTNNPQSEHLYQALILSQRVITCPTIIQEVLQGIRFDNHFKKIKDKLLATRIIEYDNLTTHLHAVDIYRTLRKKGITVRKPNDCLIASIAIQYDLMLIHNDHDFDLIAKNTALKVFEPK